MTDTEVAPALEAADMAGFAELYSKHYRRVFSICLRMMGSPSDAEDLTQEVFIQLHRKLGSFRGASAFTTWLHRLTVNQVLMHFRKRSVQMARRSESDIPEQADRATINPERMPIVDRIALERAIGQLPKGYRMVFILHDVEGYEHEEIATMLGVTSGTSKSQLHKARMALRQLLTRGKR
jgi:RNA polymerase sigma-70 factor (ECF subfamily)